MGIGALIIGDEILTGKRQDKHLPHVIETLGKRGLDLDYAHYAGDDRGRLTALLRETFMRGDLLLTFGGIGATPDDHTRQAAAAALGVPLVRHPDAVREIEAKFGAEAHPYRVLMAEFPAGSRIIPNAVNRVAAFSIHDHHFFPGFPQMAWPMLDWVLANEHAGLSRAGNGPAMPCEMTGHPASKNAQNSHDAVNGYDMNPAILNLKPTGLFEKVR